MSFSRDWSQAIAKIRREARCRIQGCRNRDLETAHTLKRQLQDEVDKDGNRKVLPVSVVPLCRNHHELYDGHKLDILPYLSYEEQADMVLHVGITRALARASSTSQ